MIGNEQRSLDNFVVESWGVIYGPYEIENVCAIISAINSQDFIAKLRANWCGENNDDKTYNNVLEEDENLNRETQKATDEYLFSVPVMPILANESGPLFVKVFEMWIHFVVVVMDFHDLEVCECTDREVDSEENE